MTLSVAPGSRVSFEVPGKRGKLRGSLTGVTGAFELDLADPSQAKGRLVVDLKSVDLERSSVVPGLELDEATALRWLELGQDVPRERQERLGQARLTVTGLRQLSRSDLLPPESTPKARDNARLLDAVAEAELELHAVRIQLLLPLRLRAEYASTDPSSPLTALHVDTRSPATVDLPTLGIVPRNAAGVLDTATQTRAGKLLGRGARLSANLTLTPSAVR